MVSWDGKMTPKCHWNPYMWRCIRAVLKFLNCAVYFPDDNSEKYPGILYPGDMTVYRAQSRLIVFIPGILYTPRITMKLYDMIQVYSSGSTVLMHYALHLTRFTYNIMPGCYKQKQRYVFWYEKWQKNILKWGNPGERLSECVEGVEIYQINF